MPPEGVRLPREGAEGHAFLKAGPPHQKREKGTTDAPPQRVRLPLEETGGHAPLGVGFPQPRETLKNGSCQGGGPKSGGGGVGV